MHSSGRWAGGRVGYVCWSQASVVSLGWKCGVLSGGYRNQRWKTPRAHPLPIPLQPLGLSPRGASPWPGTPVGGCFFPPSPNPSPRAQFSPFCRKSPPRNQGRASGRERQSLSLRWEVGLVLGRAPRPAPSPPAGSHPTPTCDPKAVGGAGARDAEGRGHVVLEEGTPLGEVVVPEEVEGVWGDTGG